MESNDDDIQLYNLLKEKIVLFVKEKSVDGSIETKDLKFKFSRFHLNKPIINKIICTLKSHDCIELEKRKILIKDLENWIQD
jgi:hypothetical protein